MYTEVKRVAARDAVIAVWSYSLLKIDSSLDVLLHHYHFKTLGNYWDAERKFVDDQAINRTINKYWPAGHTKQIIFPFHLKMGKVH